MDQIPALSQGIPTFAYVWALHPVLLVGPLETTRVDPWEKYHHTYPHQPIVSKEKLDESSPLSPTAVGYLTQKGNLLGLGT
jgi:hypothetical protein